MVVCRRRGFADRPGLELRHVERPGVALTMMASSVDDKSSTRALLDAAAIFAIALAAIAIAAAAFAEYYANPERLWRAYYHDRNSHLAFGMDLGLALRSFDPAWFFSELEKAKVWPPFHGLLLSLVMLIGGIDNRL